MAQAYPKEYYQRLIETIHECLGDGYSLERNDRGETAFGQAARRFDIPATSMHERLKTARKRYGLTVDETRYNPRPQSEPEKPFSFEDLPTDGEPTAGELIERLKARHATQKAHHDAAKLRTLCIHMDGPIGIGFFGDPHVDDPGCAWGDLERDVALCRDTEGLFACNVSDNRNNWVGRLTALYANQEVTSRQALVLIEWLFTQLPWLVILGGNHDKWGDLHGDAAQIIHRLQNVPGVYENDGCRLKITLPAGCEVTMHIRHDFPGNSQFNPAHALVRETLFGYRDHILVAGHRHQSGYVPIWHNDPVRLCQGIRVGTYKDFDHYAKEKGFRDENWARSMGVVIDPHFANDPRRYVKTFFSIEETAEYLTWRRDKFEMGYSAA